MKKSATKNKLSVWACAFVFALIVQSGTVPVSAFAQATNCIGSICIGNWVIDSNDYMGRVVNFPDAQHARYVVSGTHLVSRLTSLKAEVQELNGIRESTVVIDSNDYVGRAQRVFEDGRVAYQTSGVTLVSKRVVRSVPALDSGIREGTVVADANDYVGTVVHAFADGRVLYTVSGVNLVSKHVSGEVASRGIIQKGRRVIDANDYVGEVLHVFADTRVHYRVSGVNLISRHVSGEVDSLPGLVKGATLIDANDYIGQAQYLFEDGRASYIVNGVTLVSRRISPKVAELNGFRNGMVVIDPNEYVGFVEHVFQNGKISYITSGVRLVSSHLSKEVDTHPKYQKDEVYATPEYLTGRALRFFENGKVQLALLGSKNRTTVAAQLFSKVDRVEGYAVEQVITDSLFRRGVIKALFENGALAYDLGDGSEWVGGKLWGVFVESDREQLAQLRREELRDILIALGRDIATKENLPVFLPMPRRALLAVITPEGVREGKVALSRYLKENPNTIPSDQLREKVRRVLMRWVG